MVGFAPVPSTLKASTEGLTRIDRARRRMGLSRTRSEIWWLEAAVSQSTLRRFWAGKPIRQENFIALCRVVGIQSWQEIVDWAFLTGDVPESDLSSDLSEGGDEPTAALTRAVLPEFPDGPVPLDSEFYIERSPLEARCWDTLTRPGSLIRIKAPHQMGKTSLLNRLCHRAEEIGYQVVRLNWAIAETSLLNDLDALLLWMCRYIATQLQVSVPPETYWSNSRGSIIHCMAYIQEKILEPSSTPVVIAFDQVDVLFEAQAVYQDFFSMLRSWHEESRTLDVWGKLRLVVVHSTEIYGQLDINRSPFNVGLPAELAEFSLGEVELLLQRYQLNWQTGLAQELLEFVGGHPYLIQLALYDLAWQKSTRLDQLLQEALSDIGVYADCLRRHLYTLRDRPNLTQAFQTVVLNPEPVAVDPLLAYQLYSMGLVRRRSDRVMARGQLYRAYFPNRLAQLLNTGSRETRNPGARNAENSASEPQPWSTKSQNGHA